MAADVIFLFDVDNTLLNNDAFQDDLREHLEISFGAHVCRRYWTLFEDLRGRLGYADYLSPLEGVRLEEPHNPRLLRLANWLLDYPFADRLYPGVFETVQHVQRAGPAAILSDGDAVFQPRKINRSGLWTAFDENILIYVHKQKELEAVERCYPAKHYVLIDDKLGILEDVKNIWGDKVTTVFHRQGHYALDSNTIAKLAPADVTIDHIADLTEHDLTSPRRF